MVFLWLAFRITCDAPPKNPLGPPDPPAPPVSALCVFQFSRFALTKDADGLFRVATLAAPTRRVAAGALFTRAPRCRRASPLSISLPSSRNSPLTSVSPPRVRLPVIISSEISSVVTAAPSSSLNSCVSQNASSAIVSVSKGSSSIPTAREDRVADSSSF
jgi:hypothetical protein